MRNNALQNRHIFSEQADDDRAALVSRDPEAGIANTKNSKLPPDWIDGVEEIQYEISRIKSKLKDLSALHDKHLNRPTLDDSVDEETAIEVRTQEITQILMRCQRVVQRINSRCHQGSSNEQRLTKNIVSSLARSLQDLSTNFRRAQSSYLRKIKSREERSRLYFDTDLMLGDCCDEEDELYDRGFTSQQLQAVGDNTATIQAREKETLQIVKSIQDLNEIFKDLATMIIDQGTVLDRIDYNIEQTSTRVDSGLKQLQKAAKHQKKNRKMMIIMVLFAIVTILIIILIAVKS